MKIKSIKIIGRNSLKYYNLKQNLESAIKELDLRVEISEIEDENYFIDHKLIDIPALLVNDRVLSKGVIPTKSHLELLLSL